MSDDLIAQSTHDGILYIQDFFRRVKHREWTECVKDLETQGLVPEGMDAFRFSWNIASDCEREADKYIGNSLSQTAQQLEALGTVVSLLDRLASCAWGCRNGDHIIEYIVGRVASYTVSAVKLAWMGSYDEALLLTRSIAEIANLFKLFAVDPSSFEKWHTMESSQRNREYGPVQVRIKLEALNTELPCDKDEYASLCEVSAHASPKTKPQAHNSRNIPMMCGYYQEMGLANTINEIASFVASVASSVIGLAQLDQTRSERLLKEANVLASLVI